jgi:hypothetical protein
LQVFGRTTIPDLRVLGALTSASTRDFLRTFGEAFAHWVERHLAR